ncbi:hypothetical protein CIHG_08382 [Coccidioides immitis H538.4]|uniref:DUF676 domain-containing protein n=1 Tax=Coccidioides immitis H538.4 TaxID=396776 RepID=A0A0J8US32_COCIT|nr:hypothetical protein CIHG_08382 [Coccidioides immitis H538.4]
MLVTPRTYQLSQTPNKGLSLTPENFPTFRTLRGWSIPPEEIRRAAEMLLIHHVGSVRIGEVVRYTLTYTPSADRILPYPAELYVKIRNTSAIALRAAYLHGPYTIHTSCYPSTFDPHNKFDNHQTDGIPQFEPHLQPGAAWDATIPVPERVRNVAPARPGDSRSPDQKSISWIVEISSQVVFSNTASVTFEVLVGRDAKSTELGAASIADLPAPGNLRDHKRSLKEGKRGRAETVKGVYSESVKLKVDDTATLWTSPRFPSLADTDAPENLGTEHTHNANLNPSSNTPKGPHGIITRARTQKKVHFVVLTHGLHSNLGADMLFMKESIDAAASRAREDRKKAKQEKRRNAESSAQIRSEESGSDDEEEVIVRGFPGNAARTERGIQYLGKRLAKYVLLMTYPDQPYLPIKQTRKMSLSQTFGLSKGSESPKAHASHSGSTIYRREPEHKDFAYRITSISFIGHSLGGLVQTYAIAYIQKHSPEFFDIIKPVNFVALASPFLGLSNENPIYVKFALDFGLVGRTGQDLGLSWSAPSKMRSGWEAMIGGLGNDANKSQRNPDPGAKPLLRILPSGPAHQFQKASRETKATKIYRRSQTIRATPPEDAGSGASTTPAQPHKPGRARGDSLYEDGGLYAPPKTTLFEAAGDVISPPLPSLGYILDPSSRPRTIFHDRVYHPEDIPPPPPAKPRSMFRTSSSNSNINGADGGTEVPQLGTNSQGSGMKVEEKIARAYHREVSWRKVLVRLEPDAHNNIIVRRMFANAYGWPVVKHLVDTHFAYTQAATTADDKVRSEERALPLSATASEHGEEVRGQTDKPTDVPRPCFCPTPNRDIKDDDTTNASSEENDTVPEMIAHSRLNSPRIGSPRMCSSPVPMEDADEGSHRPVIASRASSLHSKLSRQSSAQWTDRYLEDGDDDDSDEAEMYDELRGNVRRRSLSSRSDIADSTLGNASTTTKG